VRVLVSGCHDLNVDCRRNVQSYESATHKTGCVNGSWFLNNFDSMSH
jgi:hypothetical protein